MEGIVVDQEGAQQRLLGLQIVRRRPVPLALLSVAAVAHAPPMWMSIAMLSRPLVALARPRNGFFALFG